ncbi:MAG: hypothetical protein R2711_00245 [Acidimicrobiales bacterium]
MSDAAAEPTILIKPGPLLVQAATWLGHACWAEVRLQEVLTHWLAIEPEGEHVEILWHERADAAERAEAWYRRLPELREYPRAQFIVPSSVAVAELFDRLQALDAPARSLDRRGALRPCCAACAWATSASRTSRWARPTRPPPSPSPPPCARRSARAAPTPARRGPTPSPRRAACRSARRAPGQVPLTRT